MRTRIITTWTMLGLFSLTFGARVPASSETYQYAQRDGVDAARLSLDLYHSQGDTPKPLLVFIHGGGWSIGDKSRVQYKPSWARRNGWVFASVNYRLSPDVMHPEHARDVAAAVDWLLDHADEHAIDPERVVLMGHSAGAHLAAIVATDESLLEEHGRSPSEIAGVVLLDGAGYNLAERMPTLPRFGMLSRMYKGAFGADDEDLWLSASPTHQCDEDDGLGSMLAVYVGDRDASRAASHELADAWRNAGGDALTHHAPTKDHSAINRSLGKPGDEDTKVIERFLIGVFSD